MKKLIALIVLMSGFALTAQAETKAFIVTQDNPSETLEVKEGQVATIVYWGFRSISQYPNANIGNIKITIGDKSITYSRDTFTIKNPSGWLASIGPSFHPVVPGPATIQLSRYNMDSMMTVKIENDSGVGDGNNVTVIPDSVEDATLVLEGSDDMVNWTTETLGEKPKANRKKFYRLRAKKE